MAYQYQICDSYFVLSGADHREMARKENANAYEKHQKEQRQLELAQELSELANEEYGLDILNHMEEQEVSKFTTVLIFCILLTMFSSKPYQMSLPLTSKPKSNGLCAPIFSTS